MISFENFGDLHNRDIGEFTPKPTSIAGDQMEATLALWSSANGQMETGIWECTPGRFTADRSQNAEICYLLSGRVTLHNGDGTSRDIGPGEMFVLPLGWRGEWTIHEQTRKIYTMVAGGV
ncbi:cupin domain-containing protein (plasmid) [Shinella sp. H4-D48]|uniref:cupin domain-containing protein n=1 Tax=Shinella sp. H4-D48 TaxID=2925841 RepID=UPI001F531186|nr:cupin domain-containing protein [Shinella sp. H4-D48]UNK40692.1 cupin domain-containing protein [Shinella sp. H4-D48]